MSPPAPRSPSLFAPLTSLFREVGLHRHGRPPAAVVELEPPDDPDGVGGSIGDIWQAQGAATAFDEGTLRSLSWPIGDGEGGTRDEDRGSDTGGSDRDEDDHDDSDGDSEDGLEVVFRNESPAPLVLCWVSESGGPHHFYRLEPSSPHTHTKWKWNSKRTRKHTGTTTRDPPFRLLETDHLEHTNPGHAFCLGYVESEQLLARVQHTKSLVRRDLDLDDHRCKTSNNTEDTKQRNGTRRHDTDEVDDDHRPKDSPSSIVVAGYRPFVVGSSSTSSSSMVSRRLQLITVSHISHAPPHQSRLRRMVVRGNPSRVRTRPWGCWGRRRHEAEALDPSGWRVTARWVVRSESSSKPHDTTAKAYEECALGGWPCRLEPNWSGGDAVSARKLERDIRAAAALLPPHARAYLQHRCLIWVNRSLSWGPSDRPVHGHGSCYHPSREWLVAHGLSGDKHECVEVNDAPHYKIDCDLWGIGGVMLHELSHAYHHRMLPGGYSNPDIQRCYELAMEEGLYDCVTYHSHCDGTTGTRITSTARAYACTNAMEYFAELSAAFLGGLDATNEYNKWYPFNRKQIKTHDPRAYAMLSRLWKVDVGKSCSGTTIPN